MMPVSESVATVSIPSSSLTSASTALPLVGMRITVDACNGLSRAVVRQHFRNPHAVPLSVTYAFPLPADAAVSGYTFILGDRRIEGEIARRADARERFEEAILAGKSAALLEQERTSLFTQEIGNIPPGTDVIAEIVLDQPLRWLDEGSWEWRFPTAAAPRYLGAPGDVPDARRVSLDVADSALAARATLSLLVRDPFKEGVRIESPSHALSITAPSDGDGQSVALSETAGVALDRDIVVRWRVATLGAGFTVDLGRAPSTNRALPDAYALCTLVPPSASPTSRAVPRDVIVLLDTSGSMGGEPLSQARRIVSALIDTLSDRDQLELIEFSNEARRWNRRAVPASTANRKDALAWLGRLRASGGTEMRSGIVEAMARLRDDSQRQILLVTDGQIGFEDEVVGELDRRLPPSARLHTVGVGSAVNRTLTGRAARAGRGVEVIVGLGEDPERAALRLVARTSAPLVVDVTLEGDALLEHAPARIPDLFAGAPLLVSAKVRAQGGMLRVRGSTAEGPWQAQVTLPGVAHGEGNAAVVTLFGREKVEDLELRANAEAHGTNDAAIERLGLDFSIATRMTSWLAVSDAAKVDPRDPTRRTSIPQALPHGMSALGVGLRPSAVSFGLRRGEAMAPLGAAYGAPAGFAAPPAMARARSSASAAPSRAGMPPARPAPAPARPSAIPSKRRASETESFAYEVEEARSSSPGARALAGRQVSWKDGTFVVELTADAGGLAWDPSLVSEIVVVTKTGDRVAAMLDDARTTRAATLGDGESARLTLVFEQIAPTDVAQIELVHDGETFVLTFAA